MIFKCWASDYCKRVGACNEYCDAYVLFRALYSQANMPKRYQYSNELRPSKADIQAYKKLKAYMDNIMENVVDGVGLYIWSEETGNGKTTWACKMLNQFFRKVVFNATLKCEGLYLNVPTFLEDMRKAYDEPNEDFDKLLRDAKSCKILVLDDIGSEKPSEWVQERLYTLINERVNNELVTIYTSNVDLEMLERKVGKRAVSRIKGSCHIVQFVGSDRREVI